MVRSMLSGMRNDLLVRNSGLLALALLLPR
jgi:hypothetical protein